MGNSEEAILPDDIPFDINDLDMEDEPEYNYQVGGFVPGTAQQQQMGIAGYQAPVMQQTGVAQIPQQQYTPPPIPQAPVPQMQPFARPQQQAVPTMPVPEKLPTFQETITPPSGMAPENREYINPETGERRVFTFINNQPTSVIPEGFIPISEYTAPDTTKAPTTAVQTAQVTEESQSDIDRDKEERERYARIEQRTDMAKRMGYTNFEGVLEGIFSTLGGAFTQMKDTREAGIVTGGGYITDGKGGLIDPLTGGKVESNLVKSVAKNFTYLGKPFLRTVAERAEAAETAEGRKIQQQLAQIKVDDKYNKLIEEAQSEEDRNYIADVKSEIDKNVAIGNVDVDGRIKNPAEAARLAGGSQTGYFSNQEDDSSDTSTTFDSPEFGASSYDPGGTADPGQEQDFSSGYDSFSGFADFRAEGGLIEKPKKKPKPKRMKRGGLASKK
jgi:hypothetical protein